MVFSIRGKEEEAHYFILSFVIFVLMCSAEYF